MMKKTLLLSIIAFIGLSEFANAQELVVKGVVKDNTGSSLPLAFVQDKSEKTATRTDSLGRFTLKSHPNSKIYITSAGYKSKVVEVKDDKNDIIVILAADKSDNSGSSATPATSQFNSYTTAASGTMYSPGVSNVMLPVFHPVEDTRGSRYLYKDWVTGYVVSPEDSVYKNPTYGFNYDKIMGSLLLTQDKHAAIEIDPNRIKSFTLYNELNQPTHFEYVPEIDKSHFPVLLEGGKKYKIYKLTKTKFVKNDFHTDGMTSSGNNYDEYVDEPTYYVFNVQTKQVQELGLKKKAIKTVFASEGSKVTSYLDANSGKIDEEYLKNLGDFVNQ